MVIGGAGVPAVLGWLDGVSVLLANEDEACLLGGARDPLTAGAALAERLSGRAGGIATGPARVMFASVRPGHVADSSG